MFKPSDIIIPGEGQEIPIGMVGPIPVGLTRDSEGLYIDSYVGGYRVFDETSSQGVIRTIDQMFSRLVRIHPELMKFP